MNPKLVLFFLLVTLLAELTRSQIASIQLEELSAEKLKNMISKGAKCTDFIKMFLDRIQSIDSNRINSIITINKLAINEAKALDEFYEKNAKFIGRLHCVPVLVKDNIDVKNIATTGGMKVFRNSVPSVDSTVVKRLREQGAIVIAKTNMAEFATGTEDCEMGGLCKNPFDATRTCGPSSTGSGAALASLFGLIALGTDTLGSTMNPAAYDGLFGIRPAQDEIELEGIMPLFKKQDTPCPLAKTADDLALTYFTMANKLDKLDAYSSPFVKPPGELKVSTVTNFLNDFEIFAGFTKLTYTLDPAIKSELLNTVANMKKLNVQVVEQTMSETQFNEFKTKVADVAMQQLLGCDQKCLKLNLNKYLNNAARFEVDSAYNSFDELVDSPLLSLTFQNLFSSADSKSTTLEDDCTKACAGYDTAKKALKDFMLKLFDNGVDGVLLPTTGNVAYEMGKPSSGNIIGANLLAPYTGLASINLPVNFTKPSANAPKGLPIGNLLLTTSDKLFNCIKLAKYYETAFIKPKLAAYAPAISGQWFRANENSSSLLRAFGNTLELYKLG